MPALRTLFACSVVALAAVACGAAPLDEELGRRDRGPADSPGTLGEGNGEPENDGIGEACATSTAEAAQLPLHMVVVLDKSGSMCEFTANTNPRNCNNPDSRWQQVTSALKAFFASEESKGITISLIAFPLNSGTCNASTYQTPLREGVALPDTAGVLAAEIATLTGDGSTPTRPALEGAINFGRTIEQQLAGNGKVAVLMATDGYPQDCSNNSISAAASVAAAAKDTIPTYVIGVGSRLGNLDALAEGGGTEKAFHVSTTNAQAVAQEFGEALAKIRGESLSCEYGLPAAPEGETIDFDRVNVELTGDDGKAETLTYSADCASATGWRYDDADAPTKIQLCSATCDRAKASASAKVDLVLGCATKGGPN